MCKCSGTCGCNITSTTKGEKGDASPEATLGYKVYIALISQTSTSAPTVTVLQNTIGTIVWTRDAAGEYYGTLVGAFTTDKTYFTVMDTSLDIDMERQLNGNDAVYIATAVASTQVKTDGLLTVCPIEIRVYP